jgi:NitT/TauT family transport system substrate-binding protein
MGRIRRSAWLALTAAAFAAAQPAVAQTLPTLRLGALPADPYGEAYYGVDMGFFQKAGLNVELVPIAGSAAGAAAVVGGTLDVTVSSPLQMAEAVMKGIPFVVVASGSIYTERAPGTLLCVAKDGPIHTAKDLEGKTVALNTVRTLVHLALVAWLTRNSADPAKVSTVEISFPQMAPALERGTVAATTPSEPFLSAALKTGNVRSIANFQSAIAPRYVQTVWFATSAFVQKNPELVRRFAAALYDTAKWANAHQTESAPILAKYSKLNPDAIGAMIRAEFAEQSRPAEIQTLLDAGTKFGFLSRQVGVAELLPR